MVLLKRLYEGAFDKESTTNALRRKQPPGETREDESISVTEEFSPYLKLKPLVEYLITYPGADITILNNDGDTALHIVSRYFHVGALEAMLCNINSFEQAAKYCLIAFQLLDGGAKVTIKNNSG
jgi:ankyrin repeat protein